MISRLAQLVKNLFLPTTHIILIHRTNTVQFNFASQKDIFAAAEIDKRNRRREIFGFGLEVQHNFLQDVEQ